MRSKVTLLTLVFFFISLICHSQSLLKSDFMSQLPKTSDDFQNYQFNYPLENGMDVKSSDLMDSQFSGLDVVGIYPFELQKKASVNSILYAVYQKNNFLAVYGKAFYSRGGQLVFFNSKNKISENYAFGFDRWSEIRGVSRELTNCVPNPYTYQTRPTRNAKGLITNVESELVYFYDSQDRVIKVDYRDGLFSYRYEYVNNSKCIKKITVYESNRLKADAVYNYSNDKIVSLDCAIYNTYGREGSIESEYHKSYRYDNHNNISEIKYSKRELGGSGRNIHYTFYNKYDSEGKIVESVISRMRTQFVGHYTTGSDKTPTQFIRKYSYDTKGNWIRIEDDNGFIQRDIDYFSTEKGSDALYYEDEVTVNATFGQTFYDFFDKDFYIGKYGAKNYYNVGFIVEKDGSVSEIEAYSDNSSNQERLVSAIKKLPWVPATIQEKPVRCYVFLSFRTQGNDIVIVNKDIKYTRAENEAYKIGKAKIKLKDLINKANNGNIDAKKEVASIYMHGTEVMERNVNKALELYVELAIWGDTESQNTVVSYYKEITSRPKLIARISENYVEDSPDVNQSWATTRCLAAASQGNVYAMYEAGKRKMEGRGCRKNVEDAMSYYEQAANNGNQDAMIALGEIYFHSLLGHFDEPKGIEWYTKAYEAGNSVAKEKLGYFYINGIHVKKNKKLGKKILAE